MDLDHIKQRVADIEAMKASDDAAHRAEDQLWIDFISFVATSGPPELAALAREVLRTDDIDFSRWYS